MSKQTVTRKKTSTKRTRKPAEKPQEQHPAMMLLDRLERHAVDAIAAHDALMRGIVIVPDAPTSLFGIIGDIRTLRLTLRCDLGDGAVRS